MSCDARPPDEPYRLLEASIIVTLAGGPEGGDGAASSPPAAPPAAAPAILPAIPARAPIKPAYVWAKRGSPCCGLLLKGTAPVSVSGVEQVITTIAEKIDVRILLLYRVFDCISLGRTFTNQR